MSKVLTDQIEKRTGGTAIDLPSTGKWPAASIADDAITTAKILDDNVTTAKILDNNVTLAKLSDGTQGGTIYYGASGAPTELAAGTSGQFLQTTGASANPVWASAAAGFTDVSSEATGTYTVPTGITKLLVFITGAGGGGGGGATGTDEGQGGNSGTTVIARVTVVATDTISVAVGGAGNPGTAGGDGVDGGNSTFTHASGSGTFDTITAPGGAGGSYMANGVNAVPAAGTVGASNEGISILGARGFWGYYGQGFGAASFWGGGGNSQIGRSGFPASAGTAYGSGGGGGSSSSGYNVGAAGAIGVCFIMEFK